LTLLDSQKRRFDSDGFTARISVDGLFRIAVGSSSTWAHVRCTSTTLAVRSPLWNVAGSPTRHGSRTHSDTRATGTTGRSRRRRSGGRSSGRCSRHSNPWSAWTRWASAPLILVPVWRRSWRDAALVGVWMVASPVVFNKPGHERAWATRAVLGRRAPAPRDAGRGSHGSRDGAANGVLGADGALPRLDGVWRRSVCISGGSEAPLPVMLIPHDRADPRLGCFRRCTGVGVAGHRLRASTATTFGLLVGHGCFVGWKGRWVVLSVVLAAGRARAETSLVSSHDLRDHDLLTQPVLAVCGRALWLGSPWLDYPRTRHQKSPLLERPS
jgi:hypothetical protein